MIFRNVRFPPITARLTAENGWHKQCVVHVWMRTASSGTMRLRKKQGANNIHLSHSLLLFEIKRGGLPGSLTPKLAASLVKIKNKKYTASKFPVHLSIIRRQQKRNACCSLSYTCTPTACMRDVTLMPLSYSLYLSSLYIPSHIHTQTKYVDSFLC